MGTVTSGDTGYASTATAYGNQRKVDRCQNGVLWTSIGWKSTTTPAITFAYSTDGGVTWTPSSTLTSPQSSATQPYIGNQSFFIDLDDYAHVAFKEQVSGYIYYSRGTPNAARTAYTWSAPVVVESSTAAFDFPDIVAHRDPATAGAWVAHVVYTYAAANNAKCFYRRIAINAAGAATVSASATQLGATLGASNATPAFPNIDFNHIGDAKTVANGTPHLHVVWSNGALGVGYGIRSIKATYSAGAWTFGAEREIDNAHYADDAGTGRWLSAHFDGTRLVIAGFLTAASGSDVVVHDRDAADTTTTTRTVLAQPAGGAFLASGSSTYDAAGNVYLFGEEASSAAGSRGLAYQVWSRAAGTLGARVTIDATANAAPHVAVRRGPAGQRIDYVYTDGTAAPYTVTSGSISLNQVPTAPTQQTPLDNATVDSSQSIPVTFIHNDPDGDPATAWDLRYRVAGTTGAWTTITGTTTAANGATVTATVPANTWGGVVEHQERTYDPSNNPGAWSPSRTVLAIPAATAAQTGGQGGTSASALQLYAITQAERSLRAQSLV